MVSISCVSIAQAGWFDFVGDVAKAGASTAINITWAETVKFLAPTIVLIVILIIPVICLVAGGSLTWKFIDLIEECIKDKITWKEGISILLACSLALPIIIGLVRFAYLLSEYAITGLHSLAK